MPKINAVSEGIWGLALLCIITGFVGPELWLAAPLGFGLNKIMLFTFLGFSLGTCYFHVKKILTKTDKMDLFLKCRFPLVFIILSWLIHLCNPSYSDYTFMLVVLLNLSKITILCQIAHVSQREFQSIRFVNMAIAVILALCLPFSIFSQEIASLRHTIFALTVLDFVNFAVVVASRMAKLLGIKVFIVGKKLDRSIKPETNLENQEFKKEQNNESVPDDTV